MLITMDDLRVIACNYRDGTKIASAGALAYVCWTNPGGGNDRIPILARSRGSRWVRKWEAMHRLANFRFKTIPPEHPRYEQIRDLCVQLSGENLEDLLAACVREHFTHLHVTG
jgi:hypothetical protein